MPQVNSRVSNNCRCEFNVSGRGAGSRVMAPSICRIGGAGVTLDDFLRTAGNCLCSPSPLVRMLLDIRFFVGRSSVGMRARGSPRWKLFRKRVYRRDHSRSLTGSRYARRIFPVVYRFENEQLGELIIERARAGAGALSRQDCPVLLRGYCPAA